MSFKKLPPPPEGDGFIDNVLGWTGDKLTGAAEAIFKPIGEALKDLLIIGFQTLPLALTVGGLCMFVITIMLAHRKPYFWGLACWGLSAIVKVMNSEFGI